MKNLFDANDLEALKARIARLRPDSDRQWGTMTAAQALAHCSLGMQMATGEIRPPRKLIGRILGPLIKPKVVADEQPMRRNSPTTKELVVLRHPDFAAEQLRLTALLDKFFAAGPPGCTPHPHPFFGPMTPHEWAILTYKHVDHHLRQFGV
ncbi:MAG TPA: DUF1569 domain-containing protein [Acidobacteriaceae bacterium]|nr:DUF1569 domain-containing protein [Acidobacteriaceae bacterium]